jgi:hypothetical protein
MATYTLFIRKKNKERKKSLSLIILHAYMRKEKKILQQIGM